MELVGLLTEAGSLDDARVDTVIEELRPLVPDPGVSDLIFWPQHHAASRAMAQDELTAERIDELATGYQLFSL